MGAGEEYLFSIGLLPVHGVDIKFILVRPFKPLSFSNLMVTFLINGLAVFGNLGVRPLTLGFSTSVEGRDELDTAFVKSQRVAKMGDSVVRTTERQVL